MTDIAQQAVEEGVVESGLGYWPNLRRRPALHFLYKAFGGIVPLHEPIYVSRAVLERIFVFQHQLFVKGITHKSFAGHEVGTSFVSRALYRDTVAHNRVLFWSADLSEWLAEYAAQYVDELGGRDYVTKHIGFALFPSGVQGQPGSARWSGTGAYVILSVQATGRKNQDLACTVLAKVIRPEIYLKFAESTGTLSVLEPQDLNTSQSGSFTRETSYFWDSVWRGPSPKDHPNSTQYLFVLDKYLAEVERGRLAPEDAVDSALHEIQEALGDVVIIGP